MKRIAFLLACLLPLSGALAADPNLPDLTGGPLPQLEKVTFGPYFSFDGDGSAPNGYKLAMPVASGVTGWDGNWYDAQGNAYAPSAIPEETAGTYYAVNPVKTVAP